MQLINVNARVSQRLV